MALLSLGAAVENLMRLPTSYGSCGGGADLLPRGARDVFRAA
jgi:hypothetical protein